MKLLCWLYRHVTKQMFADRIHICTYKRAHTCVRRRIRTERPCPRECRTSRCRARGVSRPVAGDAGCESFHACIQTQLGLRPCDWTLRCAMRAPPNALLPLSRDRQRLKDVASSVGETWTLQRPHYPGTKIYLPRGGGAVLHCVCTL